MNHRDAVRAIVVALLAMSPAPLLESAEQRKRRIIREHVRSAFGRTKLSMFLTDTYMEVLLRERLRRLTTPVECLS